MTETTKELARQFIREHEDIRGAYAFVCNRIIEFPSVQELLAVKQYLEEQMAQEQMEEHGWVRTGSGCWHKETNEAFWARMKANSKE